MGLFDFFKGNTTSELTRDSRIPCITHTMNFAGNRVRFVLAPYSELVNYFLSGDIQNFAKTCEKYIVNKIKGYYAIKHQGQFVFIDKDSSITVRPEPMFFIDKRLYDENLITGYDEMVGYRVSQMEKIYKSDIDVRVILGRYGY